MKSSPIYNKLEQYLIEHACLWIFHTLKCVNWIRTQRERERDIANNIATNWSYGMKYTHPLDVTISTLLWY